MSLHAHIHKKDIGSLLVTRHASHLGFVIFKVNILARSVKPSAKNYEVHDH